MPYSAAPGVVLEPSSPLDNQVQRIDNDPLAPTVTSTPGTGTTTTGEPTLGGGSFNTITWAPILDAASYDVINVDTGLYAAQGVTGLTVDDTAGPPVYQFQFFNSTFPILVDPTQPPTVTVVGTPGGAFYSFFIVAHSTFGQTLPGPSAFLFNGPNALSLTNYLTVTWDPVPGAVSYDLIDGSNSVLRATGLVGTSFNVQTQLPRATPVLDNTIQALKVADGLRFTNDSNVHWDVGEYPGTMGLFFPANDLIPGHPGIQPDAMGLLAAGESLFLLAPTINFLQGENALANFQGHLSAYSAVLSSNDDAVAPLTLQAYSPTATADFLTCLASDGLTKLAEINSLGVGIFAKLSVMASDPAQTLLAAAAAPNTVAGQNQVSFSTNVDGAAAILNQLAVMTDASLVWNAKTSTTFRTQAKIIPSWFDSIDATRKAQLSFQVRGTGAGTIEALNLRTDGTNPTLGALGATPVGRQTLPAVATDLATTQALANSLRSLAIAFGFGA